MAAQACATPCARPPQPYGGAPGDRLRLTPRGCGVERLRRSSLGHSLACFRKGCHDPRGCPRKKRRPPTSPGRREGRKTPSRREERLPQPRILDTLTDAMRTGPCGEGNWRWVPCESSIASSCCMPVLCSHGSGLWPSSLGTPLPPAPYHPR